MRVLAAGSLKAVWPALMAYFPEPVETRFGPAGLLRERIEAGEPCDLFASASEEHPQNCCTLGERWQSYRSRPINSASRFAAIGYRRETTGISY